MKTEIQKLHDLAMLLERIEYLEAQNKVMFSILSSIISDIENLKLSTPTTITIVGFKRPLSTSDNPQK